MIGTYDPASNDHPSCMTSEASLSRKPPLWTRLRARFGTAGLAVLAVLAALFLACAVHAVSGEKPWGRTVQKRLEKKKQLEPREYAIIGLWRGAVVNACLLALLLATASKWMPVPGSARAGGDAEGDEGEGHPRRTTSLPDFSQGRWRLVACGLLAGAVAVGAWERWGKLHHSLWNDEEYALRKFAHGAWEEKNGEWKFEPIPWTNTLFDSENGNNHLMNSVTMRLDLEVWRLVSGEPREAFAEHVVRMTAFLCGLGTILMVFFLGRELGSTLSGLAGAWLMALHPWHVRYASEARGYSLMMCFVSISLYALLRALRTNRLGWWLVFGLAEAVYLLSFAGSLYIAVMVNLFALVELARRKKWAQVRTLFAGNLIGAIPVLQLMLPNVPQILAFLQKEQPNYVPDVWQWYRDLGSVLLVGWPYENYFPETHHGTDWLREGQHFFYSGAGMLAPAVLTTLGVAALLAAWARGAGARLVLIAPVAAAAITCALNVRPGSPMTVWYLVYLLIPLSLAVPLLIEEAGRVVRWRWMPMVLVTWLVVRYGTVTSHARDVVRLVERQPMRSAVAFIKKESPEAMTATFGVSSQQSASYDPRAEIVKTAADLQAVVSAARTTGRPLYLFFCSDHAYIDGRRKPADQEVYNQVTKSGEFEKAAEFPGSEELFSYRVYRLKP